MRVHAVLRADNGSDVRRPAEAWRVDDPLHPAVGRAHDVELDARDHAVLCASDGRRQRVPRPTQRPAARGRCRTRPGRSPRALHPRLPGRTSADRRHAPAQDPGEQLGVEPEPDQLDALVEALAVRADPGALDLEDADAPAGGSTSSALAGMAASESATANRPLRETTGHAITSRRSYLPGVTRSRARDAGCRVTRLGTTRRADGQGASTVPVDSGSGSRSERRHRRRRPERRARRPRSARRGLAS